MITIDDAASGLFPAHVRLRAAAPADPAGTRTHDPSASLATV